MPKITQEKRDARRQQILDAALACFSREGFHNTTTADIVRASGLSQGTLYLYFANKDEIIVALADDRREGEAFLNALAEREQDPLRGLALLVELHGRGLGDPARLEARRVGVQGWGEALRNPDVQAAILEGVATVREAIAGLILRGQRTGQVNSAVDPDAAARSLIALFQGFVLLGAWGEDIELPAIGEVVKHMIGGLLTPRGRASWEAMAPPVATA